MVRQIRDNIYPRCLMLGELVPIGQLQPSEAVKVAAPQLAEKDSKHRSRQSALLRKPPPRINCLSHVNSVVWVASTSKCRRKREVEMEPGECLRATRVEDKEMRRTVWAINHVGNAVRLQQIHLMHLPMISLRPEVLP